MSNPTYSAAEIAVAISFVADNSSDDVIAMAAIRAILALLDKPTSIFDDAGVYFAVRAR